MTKTSGTLFVVATHIGNLRDITLRAIDVLNEVRAVICEEHRTGSTLLKKLGIQSKEIILVNEHNEEAQTNAILVRLLEGQSLALISDCGTPVFADPGARLVRCTRDAGVRVSPVPGPSSLMAALSILDFDMSQYYFAGFLPRKSEVRIAELKRLQSFMVPIIILDTPYRLQSLLKDVSQALGKSRQATLACDLTLPSEQIILGTLEEISRQAAELKVEFILIVHGLQKTHKHK